MNLITITDNIALVAATITGIRGANGQEVDTIPGTPWVVVGLPKAVQVINGDRTVVNMDIPIRLYVERLSTRSPASSVPLFTSTILRQVARGESLVVHGDLPVAWNRATS